MLRSPEVLADHLAALVHSCDQARHRFVTEAEDHASHSSAQLRVVGLVRKQHGQASSAAKESHCQSPVVSGTSRLWGEWLAASDRTPFASPPLMRVQRVAEPPSARHRQPGRASPGCCAGRFVLYSIRQSSMSTCASSRLSNCSTARNSSRNRPLNDSTNGFSHGAPGSMSAAGGAGEPAPVAQRVGRELGSIIATDVPPAPSRAGRRSGRAWRRWHRPLMRLAATTASASRVCSSTMLSSFRTRPSAVWSNWKSSAQTWFGHSARSPPGGLSRVPQALTLASLHRDAQPLT